MDGIWTALRYTSRHTQEVHLDAQCYVRLLINVSFYTFPWCSSPDWSTRRQHATNYYASQFPSEFLPPRTNIDIRIFTLTTDQLSDASNEWKVDWLDNWVADCVSNSPTVSITMRAPGPPRCLCWVLKARRQMLSRISFGTRSYCLTVSRTYGS